VNVLETVSENLRGLARRLQETVGALRSIGTPELLAKSEAVHEEISRLQSEMRDCRDESSSLLQEIVEYQRRGAFRKLFGKKPRQPERR
jgi:hypothetical protein